MIGCLDICVNGECMSLTHSKSSQVQCFAVFLFLFTNVFSDFDVCGKNAAAPLSSSFLLVHADLILFVWAQRYLCLIPRSGRAWNLGCNAYSIEKRGI